MHKKAIFAANLASGCKTGQSAGICNKKNISRIICWQAEGRFWEHSLLKKKTISGMVYAGKPWASLGVILAAVREPLGTHHSVSRSKACVRLSRRVSSYCSCVAGFNLLLVSYVALPKEIEIWLSLREGDSLSIEGLAVQCP